MATVAMMSTLFVSVVRADFQPTVTTVVGEKVTNADFVDYFDEDIPEGYDVYPVTVSFSDLGTLNTTIKAKKHTGRKLQGFGYAMTFDNIANVDTDYTTVYDDVFGGLAAGFDGSTYTAVFNAGKASDAYPTTAGTVDGAIEDAVTIWVVVVSGQTVTATLNTNMNVVTYASDVYGEEEATNFATMSPTSVTLGAASTPTPTYTDSSIDVKKPVSGTTGLTDLQGQDVTLTANYGIAKFSTAIDTAANNYFVVA
ncbi:MAG: hypothetical protein K5664_06325, partial [Firmicutes bacterium]|nr:hypothetical protein [Bacillota bacterium]